VVPDEHATREYWRLRSSACRTPSQSSQTWCLECYRFGQVLGSLPRDGSGPERVLLALEMWSEAGTTESTEAVPRMPGLCLLFTTHRPCRFARAEEMVGTQRGAPGRSTDRGRSRHKWGLTRAPRASRRSRTLTKLRYVEGSGLAGGPRLGRGRLSCQGSRARRGVAGGGRAPYAARAAKTGPSRECQRPKACQSAKTAEGERRTMYRRAEGFELGLAWPDCNAITYSGMRAAAPVEIPPLRQLRASNPMGS
jgi:hypothetical protein